jgi:hypothetical protein
MRKNKGDDEKEQRRLHNQQHEEEQGRLHNQQNACNKKRNQAWCRPSSPKAMCPSKWGVRAQQKDARNSESAAQRDF